MQNKTDGSIVKSSKGLAFAGGDFETVYNQAVADVVKGGPPLAAIDPKLADSSYPWAKYYRTLPGASTTPAQFTVNGNTYNGHTHHIAIERGNEYQHPFALRAQAVLRSYQIDPYFSKENLVWAPNYGHTNVYAEYVAKKLEQDKGKGFTRAEIIETLKVIAEHFTDGVDFSVLLAKL